MRNADGRGEPLVEVCGRIGLQLRALIAAEATGDLAPIESGSILTGASFGVVDWFLRAGIHACQKVNGSANSLSTEEVHLLIAIVLVHTAEAGMSVLRATNTW